MSEYRCPAHPDTKLVYVLRGGAGYCAQCHQYVRAAGVPEPEPTKATGKSVKTRKKVRAKAR